MSRGEVRLVISSSPFRVEPPALYGRTRVEEYELEIPKQGRRKGMEVSRLVARSCLCRMKRTTASQWWRRRAGCRRRRQCAASQRWSPPPHSPHSTSHNPRLRPPPAPSTLLHPPPPHPTPCDRFHPPSRPSIPSAPLPLPLPLALAAAVVCLDTSLAGEPHDGDGGLV